MKNNSEVYIKKIAETKVQYHKKKSTLPFEEKFKIIIELQKIDLEMLDKNKSRSNVKKYRRLWQITE